MTSRLVLLALLISVTNAARAGHGLINSFAGIDWLPEAGLVPVDFGWRVDRWAEHIDVMRAPTAEAAIELLNAHAMERLAEAVLLVKRMKGAAAEPALEDYASLLEQLSTRIGTLEGEARTTAQLTFAARLLEAQYILSTEYLDLPREHRTALAPAVEAAQRQYQAQRAPLSRRQQESLFFREEEVRWSWEQAQAADAQGL
jgi:hypothetical protein